MPNDTELRQLYIYVGTQAKIDEARQQGTIGPDDFVVVTDAPEFALQSSVQAIQVLIPSQATAQNQLADKNYVDNSTLPSSTKYGASFTLSVNSTDYKITATLKDQDGNTLGTSQVIDLPLESVVVSGSYDSTNKKIVLTLQNGNTIDVPVGDLVAGLQTEITAQNKLSSDLVDDTNKTNKFVTTQEKTTWNNKQNAINDLDTIRSGASSGASALQPNDDITELNNNAGYITGITSAMVTSALGYTPPTINSTNNYVPYRLSATAFGNSTLLYNSSAMAFTGKLHIGSSSPSTYSNFGRLTLYDNTPSSQVSSIALLNYGGGGGCGVAIDMYNTSANGGIPSGRFGVIDNGNYSGYLQLKVKKSGGPNNPLLPAMNIVPVPATNSLTTCVSFGQDEFNRVLFDLHKPEAVTTITDSDKRWSGSGTTYSVTGGNKFNLRLLVAVGDAVSFDNFSTEARVTAIVSNTTTMQITTDTSLGVVSNASISVKKAYFKITDESDNTKVLIDPYGKMCIGKTSPSYDLDVSGEINASTDIKINGQRVALASSVPTDTSDLTNGAGFITGITSSDVTTALGYTPYSNTNPAGYTSNVGTVTSVNNVQPDANGNVTINAGATYTAGTGIDITNDVISVTSPTLVNTATANYSLTLLGNANTNYSLSVNIGYGSTAGSINSVAIGYNARIDVGSGGGAIAIGQNSHVWGQSSNYSCIAIGTSAEAQYCTYGLALGVYSFVGSNYATAIGYNARAQHQYAIQIGQGTNSEAKTLCVGFNNTNYKLLDGTTGKIPDGRLPIATLVSSSSTNAEVVGAKLFYDTVGDIETALNTINSGV